MDTTKPSGNSYPYTEKKSKVSPILIVAIIILSVTIGVLAYLLSKESIKLDLTTEEKAIIEEQRQDLEGQLNEIILEYDSLKTNNDSINTLLMAEQAKIKQLLKIQASDATKINMYKKELETLRKVMRSYIVQIDSLNTRNRELTEENIEVRTTLRQVEQDKQQLEQQKEVLSSKVEKASVLSAKNIVAEGINRSSKPKDKINKIEKIRVCFTVRENAIAKAGSKTIYLRIIRPDDIVLGSPNSGLIEVGGQQMVYTETRELEYENQDIDMCIYWDITEELIAGTYNAILYADGFEIGRTTFILK